MRIATGHRGVSKMILHDEHLSDPAARGTGFEREAGSGKSAEAEKRLIQ